MFSLRNYIDIIEGNTTLSEQPAANPYTGADAEKFARLSPADQAWYTKGGGKPDLNDPYIAARAPNKGKLGPAPAAPAQAAPAAAGGAAAPAQSATPAPAAAPTTPSATQKVDPNQADRDDAEMGAAMRANAAGGNSTSAATGVGNPGEEAAAQAAPAQAATPAPAAGGAANPATGVNAQGQNVSINNPDGSKTNPETGVTTPAAPAQAATPAPAAAANRDSMPFGQAFADARAKGEKEFTWKGKKYAVKMAAPKQAASPKPAAKPLPGQAVSGGGQISDTPAAENIQMNEFDMDMDRIMKNMGNTNKTSSFTSNIDGKQDNTKAGFDTAMGKFNDITKDMNLPGGAKIDPTNIQSSVDSIKKGIMGQMSDMTKDITGNTTSSAPGANIPNPPTAEKQDPKDLLKKMPEADIEKLSGDDAKVLLSQLKKLAGM